jgi:saccharopine dehydrogenase-like NADP-dependent oxidoreductase
MKVLVLGGSGKIGSAVAWDLARFGGFEAVGIAGRRRDSLKRARAWIGSDRISCHVLDTADSEKTKLLMRDFDVAVVALPDRRASYKALEAAIAAGLDSVDVLEEYHRQPDPYEREGLEIPAGMTLQEYGEELHQGALREGITLLDGMGFAPGLSNVTLGEGIRKVEADRAVARVGGIPCKEAAARHPLGYMITWSFGHVLREYMVKVKVIEDGETAEVDATAGRERFVFQQFGLVEELECAITPGMPSFLYTMGGLKSFAEKTIRWPGHWQAIDALKECGLLDLQPVEFRGQMIRPREFFLSLVEPRLLPLPGDEDVCVMWNTAWGEEARADFYMWTGSDRASGISAMSRATGFSAAVAARMLARGEVEEKGIVAPEEGIRGELCQNFMKEMEKRGIVVLERVSPPT